MGDTACSGSSQSSKISVEHVSSILEKLKNRQTRDSTTNNYLSVKFIISLDYRHHLSWEEKTALFGAYLIDGGIQSSTLKSYFSAIKHTLKLDGYEWDDRKVLLSSLVRSCKLENDRVKTRLPIQKGLLELLLFELDRHFCRDSQQPYLNMLYRTMFCLAYYGMLRVGEITDSPHNVKACNIHVGDNKDKIQIVLYTSKTHGVESRPQKVKISAVEQYMSKQGMAKIQPRIFCPIKAVITYMSKRGAYLANEEAFFIMADRSPVKANQFRAVLRLLLDRLGLDSMLYDVHSFRSGRTCDLYKYGYSVEQIKILGRWKSNAVYRYLKST